MKMIFWRSQQRPGLAVAVYRHQTMEWNETIVGHICIKDIISACIIALKFYGKALFIW